MSPPTVQALIADLARAFPRQPVTEGTLRVYVRELEDVPADLLEDAVRVLIRTAEFFPTVRAVRETVAERTLALPSEADALSQVEARIRWGRDGDGDPPHVHALVRDALDHVGGWPSFRAAEKAEVVRGQFLRLYRGLRAEAVRDHQVAGLAPGPRRAELGP